MKILYIEDDENNKALVRRILTSEKGYEVFEADNGLDGIDMALIHRPHLILMDINMPGLDGFETTTRIRGLNELKGTPIIALTARSMDENREIGLVAGCDGYIMKPIDVDSFTETVEKFIRGKKEKVAKAKEKDLLRDYSQYLVKSLEDKVRKLESLNKELEKKVEKRTKDLEKSQKRLLKLEKKKTLMELAGATAHELNQPLTVLINLSEIILSSTKMDEENYSITLKIKDECNRMADIVKKIGNVSSYETKKYYKDINILDLDKASS